MSTQNMFLWRNKTIINTFWQEKSTLSGAMIMTFKVKFTDSELSFLLISETSYRHYIPQK